jgi:hypothetical protein
MNACRHAMIKEKKRNKFIGLNADQKSSNMKNLGSNCI